MKLSILFIVFSLLITTVSADTITIRLIELFNSKQPKTAQGLNDVSKLISEFRYNSSDLLATVPVSLPAKNQKVAIGDYQMTLNGNASKLKVTISKGKAVLLSTTVSISQKPVIVGSFPGGKGKKAFVFTKK